MTARKPMAVYLERGTRRVFACALDWPGWCRSGKDDDAALEALAAYAPRWAVVAAEAGIPFREPSGLEVVEELRGDATTDFGAPGAVPKADCERLTPKQAERIVSLVTASWAVLERVVAGAPASLRKGPRGGGRDRDAIVEHVEEAEGAYARQIGIHTKGLAPDAVRAAVVDVLRAARSGTPLKEKGWPARYAARRIAWHAVDHAWEIEDRSPG